MDLLFLLYIFKALLKCFKVLALLLADSTKNKINRGSRVNYQMSNENTF